jgi:hypothetical protein
MASDQDSRIDTFWRWIQHNSQALRSALSTADDTRDLEALDGIASVIYEQLAKVSSAWSMIRGDRP